MSTTTSTPVQRTVSVALACPQCGSEDLGTIEALIGVADGTASLQITPAGELTPVFSPAGYTEVLWDSSTTTGIRCRNCLWSHVGPDHLDHLTPTRTETV